MTKAARRRIPRLGFFKAGAAALAGGVGASLAGGIGTRRADAAATTAPSFAAYGTDTTYAPDTGIGFDASDSMSGFRRGVSAYGGAIGVLGVTGDVSADSRSIAFGALGLGESIALPSGGGSNSGTGVLAYAAKGGLGVEAYGSGGIGVRGMTKSDGNPAMLGVNNAGGPGLKGTSASGRGGVFQGEAAAIRLTPSTSHSHPRNGQVGDLMLDASHRLWFCKRGGNPATWKQLA